MIVCFLFPTEPGDLPKACVVVMLRSLGSHCLRFECWLFLLCHLGRSLNFSSQDFVNSIRI
jgi:hypothetical protein